MRALFPTAGPVEDTAGVFEGYRAPKRQWVRAMFIASADGAAYLDGKAGPLGSPTDQLVLAVLRAQADVVLVGAGTVRAEDYGPVRHAERLRGLRAGLGFVEPARLAVVTRTARFTGTERWIAEASTPPLIITTEHGATDVRGAETVVCGTDSVDVPTALDALASRGLTAVDCEGGPQLFAGLAASGRLDELCLTVSPMLAGPGASRISAGEPWAQALGGKLTHLYEDGGMLFARYRFGPGR